MSQERKGTVTQEEAIAEIDAATKIRTAYDVAIAEAAKNYTEAVARAREAYSDAIGNLYLPKSPIFWIR